MRRLQRRSQLSPPPPLWFSLLKPFQLVPSPHPLPVPNPFYCLGNFTATCPHWAWWLSPWASSTEGRERCGLSAAGKASGSQEYCESLLPLGRCLVCLWTYLQPNTLQHLEDLTSLWMILLPLHPTPLLTYLPKKFVFLSFTLLWPDFLENKKGSFSPLLSISKPCSH